MNMEENQEDSNENDQPNENNNRPQQHQDLQRARASRLVSQRTFREDELDNVELNSQQQFINLDDSNDSSASSNEADPDQLFEDYLRENNEAASSQARLFDSELPMVHSYLGENMENISGTNIFESGKSYEIPVCAHHSLVFPGEIFPMILIADSIIARTPDTTNEGLTFGLVFSDQAKNDSAVYGVTCQVYEKGVDDNGHITVKSKAHQRFIVMRDEDGHITTTRNHNFYAKVKILPEILLPDPLSIAMSNNMMKFQQNSSQTQKMRTFFSNSSRWPKFVFDQYHIVNVTEKVERFLAMLNIVAPIDPVLKSFWLARNVPLNQEERLKIFTSNCVNKRLLLIGESLNFMCYFICKRCRNRIAVYNDIFAMAKGNVNANYCNPAGYVHETLTVHKPLEQALRLVDRPSTDFSWFPGYAWQIAVCQKCSAHIGWKFLAVNRNLKPRTFYGLSCKSMMISPEGTSKQDDNDEDDETESE